MIIYEIKDCDYEVLLDMKHCIKEVYDMLKADVVKDVEVSTSSRYLD